MTSEDALNEGIRKLNRGPVRLFRNHVGKSWHGALQSFKNGVAVLFQARRVSSGLEVGSSDWVGYKSVVIDESWIGKKVAIFAVIEAKRPKTATQRAGRRSPKQINWIEVVREAGGLAGFAETVEQAREILGI